MKRNNMATILFIIGLLFIMASFVLLGIERHRINIELEDSERRARKAKEKLNQAIQQYQ